jgi:hypothetical protein
MDEYSSLSFSKFVAEAARMYPHTCKIYALVSVISAAQARKRTDPTATSFSFSAVQVQAVMDEGPHYLNFRILLLRQCAVCMQL